MLAVAPQLFEGLSTEDVEDQATRYLAAIVAVTEFGRPDTEDADALRLFEAGVAEALIVSLGTWIAHPHQDEEQHASMLEKVICRLRAHVVNEGTGS